MTEEENRIKNPFAGFNANLMDDDEIASYWTDPRKMWDRQAIGIDETGSIPVVLMGGRGCGKTMHLKFLSVDVQIRKFIRNKGKARAEDFLRKRKWIAIYLRFDETNLSSFKERGIDLTVWETIFKHYLEVVIGHKFITMVVHLAENDLLTIPRKIEKKVVSEVLNAMDMHAERAETKLSFGHLCSTFQTMADEVFRFVNLAALRDRPPFAPPVIPFGRLIFGLPEILAGNIPELKDKQMIVLLDEYENLLEQQQRIVNTLIKHTKPPVTFRVGTRLNGFKTFDTMVPGEFLQEDADYRSISFEVEPRNLSYKNLLEDIAKKRLESVPEFKKNGLTKIDAWLGSYDPKKEALSIVYENGTPDTDPMGKTHLSRKHIESMRLELIRLRVAGKDVDHVLSNLMCTENPLVEMLNLLLLRRNMDPKEIVSMCKAYVTGAKGDTDFRKYNLLYKKNEFGLVFQLLSIYRPKKKQYAGFDVFSMLSSGIIRNFLELCFQSFNESLFSKGNSILIEKQIPVRDQTAGAGRRAMRFFEGIERIPDHGREIQSLVRNLGTIFYSWQEDRRLSEPEVTYFNVDRTSLDEETRKVIDAAVQWSVLQQTKGMKGKSVEEPVLEVYSLNHILAPYFSISYRTRGRIRQIDARDIRSLIFGTDSVKKETRRKIARSSDSDTVMRKLTDFDG